MVRLRRVSPVDWIMLALAVLSVAMIAYETWGDPTPEQTRQIILADFVIIGVFAIEFAIRWARDERPKTFWLRNWYDLLGMIPVAHPAVRGFRLFRILRIVVILSRFGRATDRAFGEQVTAEFIRRSKNLIIELLGDAITVKVMDETLNVLQRGEYARNMADHLEERGDEMIRIIVDKIKDDPQVGRVRHMPFFDDLVGVSSRVSQRVIIDLLRDPRMDQMIKDIIQQNVEQIRASVQEKEAMKEGLLPRRRRAATA